MKLTQLIFWFLIFQYNHAALAQEPVDMIQVEHFGTNPGNLKMFMFHNGSKKDTVLKPLVIVLHGCGQSVAEIARLTGWNKLASIHDFTVVYPQQKIVNNVSTCFNWFRNNDINKGQGECESIYQMIRYMMQQYAVDSNRIFITGLSAGAAMAVVMMATHPEIFKAGSIFAGGAYKLATNAFASAGVMAGTTKKSREELVQLVANQNPGYAGKYPMMIIYQGQNDLVVNHKNASLLVDQWTGVHQTDAVPEHTSVSFMDVEDITRKEFQDSLGKPVVILYEIKNLGHRILVKPGNGNDEGGETGTYGVNRNFYSILQTAKEFGIIKD